MNTATNSRTGRLNGKVALITGAGPGLGGVIATAMAYQGARLVICDINPEALKPVAGQLAEMGAEHLAVHCDVSDRAAVDAMFAQAVQCFGTVEYAIDDSCPHAGGSLSNGKLQGTRVTCPVHGLRSTWRSLPAERADAANQDLRRARRGGQRDAHPDAHSPSDPSTPIGR